MQKIWKRTRTVYKAAHYGIVTALVSAEELVRVAIHPLPQSKVWGGVEDNLTYMLLPPR